MSNDIHSIGLSLDLTNVTNVETLSAEVSAEDTLATGSASWILDICSDKEHLKNSGSCFLSNLCEHMRSNICIFRLIL